MITINDKELSKRIRHNILDILHLWSSKEKQFEYQKNVPIANVSSELFCQWSDDFYQPQSSQFKIAFTTEEFLILSDFDEIINNIGNKLPTDLPDITEFVKTKEWKVVNQAAIETLISLIKKWEHQNLK